MNKLIGSGFKAITVKYNEESTVSRWLFIKQHLSREKVPEKPSDKTLFVINVPPFCDENSLKKTFRCCGEVQRVYCHSNPNSNIPPIENSMFFPTVPKVQTYKVAYVVFESSEGLSKALNHDSKVPLLLCSQEGTPVTGLEKWIKDYNRNVIDPVMLQKEIDDFMVVFDEEEKRKEMEQEKAGQADEEGWIKVTRKTTKHVIPRTQSARKKILEEEKRKRSRKELRHFYSFQVRESKMKQLQALRKKFEEDKKRIDTFKQARKFKPF